MSQINAVIFDMDGLLIDTEPIWRKAEIEVFDALGLHLTEEQCLETMGVRIGEIVELWYGRHPWKGPSPDQVTRDIEDLVVRYVSLYGRAKPGVLQVLNLVHDRGMPSAIASSSSTKLIVATLDRLGLTSLIDATCSAENEPQGKPHPGVYLAAARRLGVTPTTCLAFEDSPNGILSAKAAGMYCIVIPDPLLAHDPRMDCADLRLPSLECFTETLFEELCRAGSVAWPSRGTNRFST